jgi:hypothetical protein
MISYHIYLSVALAHKESQMEAARQAHQARSLRRLARTSRPRRSFLSRIAGRLGALIYADGHGVVALAPGDQHTPCVQARSGHSTRPAARGDELR